MKTHANPPIRRRTSNLEATGSTPVGRANYTPEIRRLMAELSLAVRVVVGTMRKRAAQSEQILSQFKAQSLAGRFA